jgi:hypothetical protein
MGGVTRCHIRYSLSTIHYNPTNYVSLQDAIGYILTGNSIPQPL